MTPETGNETLSRRLPGLLAAGLAMAQAVVPDPTLTPGAMQEPRLRAQETLSSESRQRGRGITCPPCMIRIVISAEAVA